MTDDTPCDGTTGMLPTFPMSRCPGCGHCSYLVGAGAPACLACTADLVPTPLDTHHDDDTTTGNHNPPTRSHNDYAHQVAADLQAAGYDTTVIDDIGRAMSDPNEGVRRLARIGVTFQPTTRRQRWALRFPLTRRRATVRLQRQILDAIEVAQGTPTLVPDEGWPTPPVLLPPDAPGWLHDRIVDALMSYDGQVVPFVDVDDLATHLVVELSRPGVSR